MVDFLLSFSLYAAVCRMFVVSTDGNCAFTASYVSTNMLSHTCSYEAFTRLVWPWVGYCLVLCLHSLYELTE